jgi:hypothetical protein
MTFRSREADLLGEAAVTVHDNRNVFGDLALHNLFQQTLLVGLVSSIGYYPRDLVLDATSPFIGLR